MNKHYAAAIAMEKTLPREHVSPEQQQNFADARQAAILAGILLELAEANRISRMELELRAHTSDGVDAAMLCNRLSASIIPGAWGSAPAAEGEQP